jgi:hypothetical protein
MWDHSDHKENVKACDDKDIVAYIEKLEKKLEQLHNHSIDNIIQAR